MSTEMVSSIPMMQSRSSPIASPVVHHRGFTLAELLCVVVILALMSSVLATSLVRASPNRDRQVALGHLVTYLSLARLESLRTSRPRRVDIKIDNRTLHASIEDQSARSWSIPPTTLSAQRSLAATSLQTSFDASGRTLARRWNFIPEHANEPIWTIAFDPLSGSPRLMRTDKDLLP